MFSITALATTTISLTLIIFSLEISSMHGVTDIVAVTKAFLRLKTLGFYLGLSYQKYFTKFLKKLPKSLVVSLHIIVKIIKKQGKSSVQKSDRK